MSIGKRPLLAVMIDADNVSSKHAAAMLREISEIGDPALRRVYGDWSNSALSGWHEKIRELGMTARQQSANTTGKNASDIGLVIDAMDILHSDRFDGFVLVSSDSDFTQLASRLREDGKMVVGIGEAKTPLALRNVCNRFVLIENIVGDSGKGEEPTDSKRPIAEVVNLIRAAMTKIEQEGEWYNLAPIGSYIAAANPDFDARTYGASKLSALVKTLPGLDTRQNGTHLQIRLSRNGKHLMK